MKRAEALAVQAGTSAQQPKEFRMSQQDEATTEPVWEDPPKGGGQGPPRVWVKRLAPLKEHPGKWARFDDLHTATAYSIKAGRLSGIGAGEFEVVVRGQVQPNGKATAYIRYIGNGSVSP